MKRVSIRTYPWVSLYRVMTPEVAARVVVRMALVTHLRQLKSMIRSGS